MKDYLTHGTELTAMVVITLDAGGFGKKRSAGEKIPATMPVILRCYRQEAAPTHIGGSSPRAGRRLLMSLTPEVTLCSMWESPQISVLTLFWWPDLQLSHNASASRSHCLPDCWTQIRAQPQTLRGPHRHEFQSSSEYLVDLMYKTEGQKTSLRGQMKTRIHVGLGLGQGHLA